MTDPLAVEAAFRRRLLLDELKLLAERGVDVDGWKEKVESASPKWLAEFELEIGDLDPISEDEPLDWDVPDQDWEPWSPEPSELRDRISGAWHGRIAGCILGKPLEGVGLGRPVADLHAYLRKSGQYPLTDFIADRADLSREVLGGSLWCPASQAGNVAFAESDDDLRYSFLGVEVAEATHGKVTTADVARAWIRSLPNGFCFTAEQCALANMHRLGVHSVESYGADAWDYVRRHRNPYREFIGAAIRADGWGYAAAGDPLKAASMAQQDARLSHERNGEYSEVFFAAWIAGAFRWNLAEARERAVELIPPRSRLALAVRETVALCDHGKTPFQEVCDQIHAKYGHYDPVHAINNAVVCVAAVERGQGDFERSICEAVMMGLDTDCNGATVGSILGAHLGMAKLPRQKWTEPFRDTIRLDLPQFASGSIESIVDQTVKAWNTVRRG